MGGEALLRAIVARPDDDAPRLVYADWLDEHGQPERAEFIRLQCDLARRPEGDPARAALEAREAELLKARERSWVPPDDLALFFTWRRGFVAVLHPAARGVFEGEDSLKVLAEFPLAEELDFGFCMSDKEFRHMPDLPNLRAFGVGGNVRLTAASTRRIGRWRTLRRLRLNCDQLGDHALPHLAGLTGLRELDLSYSGVTDAGLPALTPLAALEDLDLSHTQVTGSRLSALAALPRLRKLNLTDTRAWDELAGLAGCRALEELRVGSDLRSLGDADLTPLADLPALRVLDLGGWGEPSPASREALFDTHPLLDLWYNGVRHTAPGRQPQTPDQ